MDLKEFLRKLYDRGADPYGLTGKRDDTMDMVLALGDYYGSEDPAVLMGNEQPPATQQQEGPVGGGGRDGYEEIWRKFREMNPNLDYDKVAAQAIEKGGGRGISVPGGTYSQMPDNNFPADHPQSDEAFSKWVKDFAYDQEFASKTDPRSRAYDPQGAALMVEGRNNELKNKAEALKAEAWMKDANNKEAELFFARNAGNREEPPDPGDVIKSAELAIKYGGDEAFPIAMMAISLASQGMTREAYALLAKAGMANARGSEMDPDNAPPPPGVEKLGEGAVSPTGSKLKWNGSEWVY